MKPGQNDFEDLSAFADGELDASRAAEIDRLIQTDPQWQRAMGRLGDLDRALDAMSAPTMDPALPDRIIGSIHRRIRRGRLAWTARIGAALAAAAAIAIVALVVLEHLSSRHQPVDVDHDTPLVSDENAGKQTASKDEELIIQHLDFYRDMEVVENYETLEAIESLEASSTGT